MSDDEVESFEITDRDLEDEFNINRRQRRPTKHQHIYGIWADNDSGDEGPSTRAAFKKAIPSKKKKAYTAPVSFVAGGIQQAGKPKKPGAGSKEDEEEDDDDDDDEEDGKGQRLALGRGSSSSSEDDTRPSFVGASKSFQKYVDGDIAGLRKKKNRFDDTLAKKGVGNWEKHTKGIGAKLLLQMGYQPGKGLGKDLQGIQTPIEARLRKGKGAIGAYGPETGPTMAEAVTEKKGDKNLTAKVSQWRKDGGTSKKKKVEYVYKSIEDVLEESKGPTKVRREFSELSKVKVIDMTGPEQRVLSGYHAISGVQKPSDQWEIRKEKKFTNFELPELQHNLNLLVDMCEEAIVQNNKNLSYAEDRSIALEADLANIKKIEDQEAKTIVTLEKVLSIVEDLTSKGENNTLTLDMAAEAFAELKEKYYSEYCAYEVQALAVGVVRPLLKDHLSTWQPLQNPTSPIEIFMKWRKLLEMDTTFPYAASPQDPYQRLIWDAWMPCIRIAVSTWNCRKCEAMINLLEKWIPMVPSWTIDNIIHQLILPKIQHEVEEWNPLTDTVPIHLWIHPWLPHAGTKSLESTVFPIIRHKLSVALVNWHPSDPSARLMLQPWTKVFNKGEMDAFIVNNILPKLHITLQDMVINPHQQHLENWNWVNDWSEMIPTHTMAALLDKSFFPKWLQVLTLWLNLNPNYDQVTNWYQGWKGMISARLLKEPTVREHLDTALSLMSRSAGGAQTQAPQAAARPPTPPPPKYQQSAAECGRSASQIPHGFKELVEKRCEERGILWVPMTNRYREAKQIYKCGSVQCYIDRNVLFACEKGLWGPISLQELLNRAVQ